MGRGQAPESGQWSTEDGHHDEARGEDEAGVCAGGGGGGHNSQADRVAQPPGHSTTTDEDQGEGLEPDSFQCAGYPPPPRAPPPPPPSVDSAYQWEKRMRWTWSPVPPRSLEGNRGGGGQEKTLLRQRTADMNRLVRPHTPRTKYTSYQIWCHTEQGPPTKRHTLGTWRLSTKGNLPTGRQDPCHSHHMWGKFQGHIEKVQRAM